MKKVFLGGTVSTSNWRDILISKLDKNKINWFNPVVKDWTEECKNEELKQRELCDYCLYVITPKMEGVYSIAEVVEDSIKRPKKTIFCYLEKDEKDTFFISQIKSLNAVGEMVERNGGKWFKTLDDVINYLNK